MPDNKTIFIINTNSVTLGMLNELFMSVAPDIVIRNIVDESLLAEVLENNGPTPGVIRRLCNFFVQAESAGADLIFNQCSSVGEVADLAAKMVSIPVVKIDERMARLACQNGTRIGVVATVPTTLGPTVRLIQNTAREMHKDLEITEILCPDAFQALKAGDRQEHNRIVRESIENLYDKVDLIVCAQASMSPIVADMDAPPLPVLTSPQPGVKHAVEVLRSQKA
jgi:aspartate/glutamate racemase